jgi:16S rRNA (cytidine1402-2'-O)-methyltransferase
LVLRSMAELLHPKKGVLYVVGTPIGNLEDITYRAVRILREAGLIACEDTRHTRKLLDHYGIETKLISYHEHNEAERARELVERLQEGVSVAQVSDAGMPGISDPGYRVIKSAIEHAITVVPVPGPSALIAAVAASGLPTDAVEFRGCLPAKSGQRRTELESIRSRGDTVIFYEAPHRIRETLADIVVVLGPERPVVVARELTKVHEEFMRGTAGEIAGQAHERELKGEITILIGKSAAQERGAAVVDLGARLREIMREQNLDEKAALKVLAKERGLSKSEVYLEVQRGSKGQRK